MRGLEEFLREYTEAVGGVWDEVEAEVYDVLLPFEVTSHVQGLNAGSTDMMNAQKEQEEKEEALIRLTFDPEAMVEHPQAQLLTFGSPFLERLFQHAHQRCRLGQAYLTGFYLFPRHLPGRLQRALTLPQEVSIEVHQGRPLYFSNAVFWFQATFISDEKEQEIFPIAIDLHSGRQIRHLDSLIAPDPPLALVESRPFPFPDAPRLSLGKGYRLAWDHLVGTIEAIANQRQREIKVRVGRQMERMTRYFQDMREELHERLEKTRKKKEKEASVLALEARLDAVNREERVRLAELQQKTALRVELRLMNLLWIKQPKLQVRIGLQSRKGQAAETHLTWDPLTEKPEALDCPICGRSSLALGIHRSGRVACLGCIS